MTEKARERRIDICDKINHTVHRADNGGWLIAARVHITTAQDASQEEYGPESPHTRFSTGI